MQERCLSGLVEIETERRRIMWHGSEENEPFHDLGEGGKIRNGAMVERLKRVEILT